MKTWGGFKKCFCSQIYTLQATFSSNHYQFYTDSVLPILAALSAIEHQWIAVGTGQGTQGRIHQTNIKESENIFDQKNLTCI